jgi:hypothetical protein
MTPAFRSFAITREFNLRWEVQTPDGQVYARLYEIERTP